MGGRGTGKSFVGAYNLIRKAQPGRHYLVAAPTYPMMRDTSFRSFEEVAKSLGQWGEVYKTEMRVCLANGAQVAFRSAEDPEKLRGPNLSGVWLDEASLMRRAAFDICIASLREGGEQGWLAATFTPKGRRHWTYNVFAKTTRDTELIHARTAENPFLPPEFERAIREQYTQHLAAQELGGEFLDAQGYLFNPSWFEVEEAAPRKLTKVRAWDWAATVPKEGSDPDYTVGALVGKDAAGIFHVLDIRRTRTTPRNVEAMVKQTAALDGQEVAIWLEREPGASGIGMVESYKRLLAGYNVHDLAPTGDKAVRAQAFAAQAEAGNVKLLAGAWNKEFLDEVEMFPLGEHDDQVDASVMAFNMLALGPYKTVQIFV